MTVAERLHHVETKQPLELDQIDFTMCDPEGVARELAAPLEYAQRVEAVVAAMGVEHMLPRRDDRIDRFLTVWSDDEVTHGRALGTLMSLIGLSPVVIDDAVPVSSRLVGAIGRASASLQDVITAIWATSGALNEHLAMSAYIRMDSILQDRDERALHETMFRRLRAHESSHKSFYAAYAAEAWDTMQPWQRRLARWLTETTWAPVGARSAADRPAFARTVATLAPTDWHHHLVGPLQSLAERILGAGEQLDGFVWRSVVRCLEADPAGAELIRNADAR